MIGESMDVYWLCLDGVDLLKECTRVVSQEENVVCRCPLSLRRLNNECLYV